MDDESEDKEVVEEGSNQEAEGDREANKEQIAQTWTRQESGKNDRKEIKEAEEREIT